MFLDWGDAGLSGLPLTWSTVERAQVSILVSILHADASLM